MPTTSIMTIPGLTFTNPSLPKLEKDPSLTNGVLGLWDALSTDSWPSQAAPAAGANTWLNLGRSGAALNATLSTALTWANGFVRPGGTTNDINLGAPDLSTGNPNVLLLEWVKIPAVPTAFTPVLGRADATSATANYQFLLSLDAAGKLRLDVMLLDADGTTIRVVVVNAPTAITAGVHQLGFSVTFAGNTATCAIYQDGGQVASATGTGSRLNPSTLNISLGDRRVGNGGGTAVSGYVYYRAHLENLSASMAAVPGRTAANVTLSAYNVNISRFA